MPENGLDRERLDVDLHADAADPRVRGAGEADVRGAPRRDPRPHAPRRRRRGLDRRLARRDAARRPAARDLPLPRLPDRARHRSEGDDGRDLRPRGRALQGLRRLDAPDRRRARLPRHVRASSARASRTRPAPAYAAQIRGKGQVVLCFFGDGASKQGAFHESLNIASLWKLPVVFVMENNNYNVVTRIEQEDANAAAGEPLAVKAKAYSMPGVTVDGGDPGRRLRAGRGGGRARALGRRADARRVARLPAERPRQHHRPARRSRSTSRSTRRSPSSATPEEYEAALRGDPVPRFRARLVTDGTLTAEEADAIAEAVRDEMQEAVDFGLESPFPARGRGRQVRLRLGGEAMARELPYIAAIEEAIHAGDGARRDGPLLRPEHRDHRERPVPAGVRLATASA